MVSLDQVIIFLFVMQIWIGRWHTNHVDFRSRSRSLARNLSLNFFFSSRRRHTRGLSDWSSDVCSSDLSGKPCHWRTAYTVIRRARDLLIERIGSTREEQRALSHAFYVLIIRDPEAPTWLKIKAQ